MRTKQCVMSAIVILGLSMMVACGRAPDGAVSAAAQQTRPTPTSGVESNTGTGVIDATPIPDEEAATQSRGQSEPGAAATADGVVEDPEPQQQPQGGASEVYTDNTYKWSVTYPENFTFSMQTAEKLAALEPKPSAAFLFMSPARAASDVAEFEPADLEVRTYSAAQSASLEEWLASNGLVPADGSAPAKPFNKAHVAGLEVCATTMLAPGCSYFVVGNSWIYQLIPSSQEGEAMLDTFTLNQ